jgi:hypothetical protein
MIGSVLTWWLASFGLLFGYGLLVALEARRGTRYGVTRLRTYADRAVVWCAHTYRRFVRSFLQLRWHYWVHCAYRAVLLALQRVYHRVEDRFEANRQRAKQLKRAVKASQTESSSHLSTVAQHKVDTALTAAQKRKLKKKSLEQKW